MSEFLLTKVDIRKLIVILYRERWDEFLSICDKQRIVSRIYLTCEMLKRMKELLNDDQKKLVGIALCDFVFRFGSKEERDEISSRYEFGEIVDFYERYDDWPYGSMQYILEKFSDVVSFEEIVSKFKERERGEEFFSLFPRSVYEKVVEINFGKYAEIIFPYTYDPHSCDIETENFPAKLTEYLFPSFSGFDEALKDEKIFEVGVSCIFAMLKKYTCMKDDGFFVMLENKVRESPGLFKVKDLPKNYIIAELSKLAIEKKSAIYCEFLSRCKEMSNELIYAKLCEMLKSKI